MVGDIAAFRSFAADSTALKSMLESRSNTFKSGIDLDSYLSGGASYSSASGLEVRRHERPQNRSKTMKNHENCEKNMIFGPKIDFFELVPFGYQGLRCAYS